jgi:hypothetical protein
MYKMNKRDGIMEYIVKQKIIEQLIEIDEA